MGGTGRMVQGGMKAMTNSILIAVLMNSIMPVEANQDVNQTLTTVG